MKIKASVLSGGDEHGSGKVELVPHVEHLLVDNSRAFSRLKVSKVRPTTRSDIFMVEKFRLPETFLLWVV